MTRMPWQWCLEVPVLQQVQWGPSAGLFLLNSRGDTK